MENRVITTILDIKRKKHGNKTPRQSGLLNKVLEH